MILASWLTRFLAGAARGVSGQARRLKERISDTGAGNGIIISLAGHCRDKKTGRTMPGRLSIVLIAGCLALSGCARRVPKPAGIAPGTPYVSWVFMSGDLDNPDREFVCQSTPASECVMPVSSPDNRVFSDLHFYFHGAGGETKYAGSIQVGFFQGSADANRVAVNITATKDGAITNLSALDAVTSTPGTYAVTFDLVATSVAARKSQPIRDQVSVVVK
jgi:hypothetical protein